MAEGKFITFEGGEGAGKTTQIGRLKNRLETAGIPVITTREPGGVPIAETLRDVVVKGDVDSLSAMGELLVITAGRVEHLRQKIIPALQKGTWVISDRFYDSSAVYQGIAGGLGRSTVMDIQQKALGDFTPDLTFIFDLPVETGLRRAGKRESSQASGEDRFERKGLEFHEKLRAGYQQIAATEDRCSLVDATQTIDQIDAEIWQTVKARLL